VASSFAMGTLAIDPPRPGCSVDEDWYPSGLMSEASGSLATSGHTSQSELVTYEKDMAATD